MDTEINMSSTRARRKSKDLTEDELKGLKVAFDLIDQNQDGVVNVTELHEMLSMLGIDLSIEILQTLIINLSKSGNENLDEYDFLHFIKKIDELQTLMTSATIENRVDDSNNNNNTDDISEDLQAAFKIFDFEGKGYITKNELADVMIMLGEKLSDNELDRIWKVADVDKDGKINYKGFKHFDFPYCIFVVKKVVQYTKSLIQN